MFYILTYTIQGILLLFFNDGQSTLYSTLKNNLVDLVCFKHFINKGYDDLTWKKPSALLTTSRKTAKSFSKELKFSIHVGASGFVLFTSCSSYLFVLVDVFVGHACEELLEVLSLVALPALPVGLQVGVEALHLVLALLHLHRDLGRHRHSYSYNQGGSD